MTYHLWTTEGKCNYQQDRYVMIDNSGVVRNDDDALLNNDMILFGVMDGHGGEHIADYVSKVLPDYLTKQNIMFDNTPRPYSSYVAYIQTAIDMIQSDLNAKHQNSTKEGTTVCLAMLYKYKQHNILMTINIGDSRCIACNIDGIGISLTKDHKPNGAFERRAIEARGGKITTDSSGTTRVDDILAVGRAIGDFDLLNHIDYMPDIHNHPNDYWFIIVATDGLWDVMCTEDVTDFVLREIIANPTIINESTDKKRNNIAAKLADRALELGSEDNITIIIYFQDHIMNASRM